MKKFVVPGIEKPMSAIAMGTDGFGVGKSVSAAEELLDIYVAAGGNVIDTARMYGRPDVGEYGICERVTGDWMARRGNRKDLVLSTKGGFPGVDGRRRLDRESLMNDVRDSLAALQTDVIDIWWLHRDDPDRPVEDIMDTLGEMIARGYVKCVGASNWSPERIRLANAYAKAQGMPGFAGNQPQWSLARQVVNPDPTLQIMNGETYRMHMETGMLCMPFSAQAKGYIAKLVTGGEDALPAKAKARFHFPENVAIVEKLKIMCAEMNCSAAALSLAYLTSQPFATVPIISASRPEQLTDSLTAGDITLTAQQCGHLRNMMQEV